MNVRKVEIQRARQRGACAQRNGGTKRNPFPRNPLRREWNRGYRCSTKEYARFISRCVVVHVATAAPKDGTTVVAELPGFCKKCDAPMDYGFGLAGGGFGEYATCSRGCPGLLKVIMDDDEG